MNSNKNYRTTDERRDILKIPLIEGHKNIIYRDIEDKGVAEDVINIIEFTVKTSDDENKFDVIVEALCPLIQEKARHVVSKLYMYKRRPCRFNNLCKDDRCIFVHDKDKQNKNIDAKRKLEDFGHKRTRMVENNKSKEVVLNRVDSGKYNEEDIRRYVNTFGDVESIKKLNDAKYLVVYADSDSAKRLVHSKDLVLGDEKIKKYYNVVENMKKYELNSLLDKQENLLNNLEGSVDNEIVEELRKNLSRVKFLIKESSDGSVVPQENKKSINTSKSLYYNSF